MNKNLNNVLMCYHVYLQYLQKEEQMCKNPFFLIERHDIDLPTEEYDTSKSTVELSLKPTDTETWEALSDMPTFQV